MRAERLVISLLRVGTFAARAEEPSPPPLRPPDLRAFTPEFTSRRVANRPGREPFEFQMP